MKSGVQGEIFNMTWNASEKTKGWSKLLKDRDGKLPGYLWDDLRQFIRDNAENYTSDLSWSQADFVKLIDAVESHDAEKGNLLTDGEAAEVGKQYEEQLDNVLEKPFFVVTNETEKSPRLKIDYNLWEDICKHFCQYRKAPSCFYNNKYFGDAPHHVDFYRCPAVFPKARDELQAVEKGAGGNDD